MNRHLKVCRKGDLTLGDDILAQAVYSLYAEFLRNLAGVHDTAVHDVEVLAVGDHLQPCVVRLHHGLRHDTGVPDRSAVVRNRNAASVVELLEVAHLNSAKPLGNAAHGVNAGLGVLRLLDDVVHRFRVVDSGIRIRHAGNCGNSACRRGVSAGDDILLVGLTGIAKMHMHIAYSGNDRQSLAVNDLRVRGGDILADVAYQVVADKYIRPALESAGAVNDISVFQ